MSWSFNPLPLTQAQAREELQHKRDNAVAEAKELSAQLTLQGQHNMAVQV